jgi:hypothetical protein
MIDRAATASAHRLRLYATLAIAVLVLLAAESVTAQENVDTATAQLADGSRIVAPLRTISAGEVRLGDRSTPVAATDLMRIDFRGHTYSAPPRASLIQLVNGDRIVAGLTRMNDEAFVALWKSHSDWLGLRIPSETIAGILMTAPADALQRSRWFTQIFGRRAKSDVVLLLNGDRVAGDLVSFDQPNLKLAQGGKPLQIEMARIRGVAFNSNLSSRPAAKQPRIHVMLTDGSQLTGYGAGRERGGPLHMTTEFETPLELPLSAVYSIRFLDGRTTYLSDLEPHEVGATGFFGLPQPISPAKDRNVLGGPLCVRGIDYPKGLGTRSHSRIEYDLGGRYRHFQATAALDDLAEGKGSVRFIVERDSARIFESGLVTGASAPLAIGPLDLTGAHRLALIIDYGELADINDWADWLDAVVLR